MIQQLHTVKYLVKMLEEKLELQQIIMTDGSVDLQIIIQLLHGMDLINQKICILQKQMVLTELQDFGLLL